MCHGDVLWWRKQFWSLEHESGVSGEYDDKGDGDDGGKNEYFLVM